MTQITISIDPETSKLTWTIVGDVSDAVRLRDSFLEPKGTQQVLSATIDKLVERLIKTGAPIQPLVSARAKQINKE